MKEYLIIIPVYNEESAVLKVAIETQKISNTWADILFVNDGSIDNTKTKLDEIKTQFPEIFIHHKVKNSGYGSSLFYGFDFAIESQ